MTFYLQEGVPENAQGFPVRRTFLAEYLHMDCVEIRKIEAADWKSAREQVSDFEMAV